MEHSRLSKFFTPERSAAFNAIGRGLSQLGSGQAVNLAPELQALQQRQQRAEFKRSIGESGILNQFTPQQQAVIASMPPELAQQVLMRAAFPAERSIIKGADGFNYYQDTGERVLPDIESGGAVPAGFDSLDRQAQAAGLERGTPEYEAFMLNGGGDPATFRALDLQAKAAGFVPGTPEYAEFMATRGAGQKAFAAATGTDRADIGTGGLAEEAKAEGAGLGRAKAERTIELDEMQRNMSSLMVVVGQLDDLADKATYTTAGQLADTLRRETGLEASPGAKARAEYIAVVANQILPLLRQTFGAAFTAAEGESLKATLGAPDASPEEKKAVLSAFIAQKKRDLEARGGTVPAPKSSIYDNFENFSADPGVQAAAEKVGVTVQQMWDAQSE